MTSLYDNRYAPLTFSIGFLEAPVEQVASALEKWRTGHCRSVTAAEIADPLPQLFHRLEPLTVPRRRELVLATTAGWAAYFDNGAKGGDPASTVGHMATVLKCRGLAIKCVPDTLNDSIKNARGTYGAVQFELFAAEAKEFLNYERTISVANDGGKWVFSANGTIQKFEKPEYYRAKRVQDRFTPELLEAYCVAIGLKPFDPSFYRAPAFLVVVNDPLPPGSSPVSLKEARLRMGIEPNLVTDPAS